VRNLGGDSCAQLWEPKRLNDSSLLEPWEFHRHLHKSAPFLFFNGNTFADIGRRLADALFADLPSVRRRKFASAGAHSIAAVLDRESMFAPAESLCESATFAPGDRVQTLRGSTSGTVVRILEDGWISWKPHGSGIELIALPESLKKADRLILGGSRSFA